MERRTRTPKTQTAAQAAGGSGIDLPGQGPHQGADLGSGLDRHGANGLAVEAGQSSAHEHGSCAVCGTRDARVLVMVELCGGAAAVLCGSHAVMHSRSNVACRTVSELRALLSERRSTDRRAQGEVDELAERLSAAFTRERRAVERRGEAIVGTLDPAVSASQ